MLFCSSIYLGHTLIAVRENLASPACTQTALGLCVVCFVVGIIKRSLSSFILTPALLITWLLLIPQHFSPRCKDMTLASRFAPLGCGRAGSALLARLHLSADKTGRAVPPPRLRCIKFITLIRGLEMAEEETCHSK